MTFFTHHNSSFKPILLYAIYIVCCTSILGLLNMAQQRSPLRGTIPKGEQIIQIRKARESYKNDGENVPVRQGPYYYEEQVPVIVHAESFVRQDENDAKKKEYLNNYWRFYPSRSAVEDSTEDYSNDMLSKDNNFYYNRNYLASMNNRGPQQLNQDMLREETTPPPRNVDYPLEKQSGYNNILSVMRDLKKLWDIYQAFSAALSPSQIQSNQTNVIHPRIMKNHTNQHTKTRSKAGSQSQRSLEKYDMYRNKRQSPDNENEGRYIKGDPLKGYYDFVISEGSYKFWAVFQVGTAILIIYSTFAAIYYSKVNPLTTDYDYTDYLGGARGFPADDLDFDDVGENNKISNEHSNTETSSWYSNLTPNIGGVLKNVLELVDKLPVNNDTINDVKPVASNIGLDKYDLNRKKLKRQIFNPM